MSKYMIIDGIRVEFDKEKNILELVRKAGIDLPTFCYYSELSIYGACRMCMVEDMKGNIIASCSEPPRDKMEIRTNTAKLHHHRKMIIRLLLASHDRDCTVCEKSGKCKLQELALRFGLHEVDFPGGNTNNKIHEIDKSSRAVIRDPNKCVLCGDCVRMCSEVQNVGAIDFAHRGSKMIVSPAFGKKLGETNCVNCGQCAAVCPTGAITVRSDTKELWKAIYNPNKRVVAQIAPAVRVALGEEFGLEPGTDVIGKIVSVMRRLGFDEVFDTSMGADLTVMEESKEFLKKIKKGDREYPLFTSCCPAWIRYCETKHPDLMKYVSSCKSPMSMFGSVIKKYYEENTDDEREVVSVAVMPCTAKKMEAARDEFNIDGIRDVDIVITTQELSRMIKEIGIRFDEVEAESSDMPFALFSGAGVIFGVTGGVTEAVMRRVYEDGSSKTLREIEYTGVRGMEGVKEFTIPYGDENLRIGVVSGLANAEKLIEKIKNKEERFDLVEVMACPGGCVSGAGQPETMFANKAKRASGLYRSDKVSQFKCSQENPVVTKLYSDLLKNREKELLHVHYHYNK